MLNQCGKKYIQSNIIYISIYSYFDSYWADTIIVEYTERKNVYWDIGVCWVIQYCSFAENLRRVEGFKFYSSTHDLNIHCDMKHILFENNMNVKFSEKFPIDNIACMNWIRVTILEGINSENIFENKFNG